MDNATDIVGVAALLADSSRSTMLQALMDRRARTAGELAILAKIAPSTASQHLGRLTDGGLLVVEAQGRHRYYRLATPRVAALLESIMALAPHRCVTRTERRLRPALCSYLLRPPCWDHRGCALRPAAVRWHIERHIRRDHAHSGWRPASAIARC